MAPLGVRVALAAALCAGPALAGAQARHAFFYGGAFARVDHRDPMVSPRAYAGVQPAGLFGYQRTTPASRTWTGASLGYGSWAVSDGGSQERIPGAVWLGHTRRLGRAVMVGAQVRADAHLLRHTYASLGHENFIGASVGIAPVVEGELVWPANTRLAAEGTIAAYTLRSYSRAKAGGSATQWRWPNTWRDVTVRLDRESRLRRRIGVQYGYALRARSLAEPQGFAMVENSVHLAVLLRLGALR